MASATALPITVNQGTRDIVNSDGVEIRKKNKATAKKKNQSPN